MLNRVTDVGICAVIGGCLLISRIEVNFNDKPFAANAARRSVSAAEGAQSRGGRRSWNACACSLSHNSLRRETARRKQCGYIDRIF